MASFWTLILVIILGDLTPKAKAKINQTKSNKKLLHSKGTINNIIRQGLPWCPVVKNSPCNVGDTGSNPDPRRSHMLQTI